MKPSSSKPQIVHKDPFQVIECRFHKIPVVLFPSVFNDTQGVKLWLTTVAGSKRQRGH